MTADALDAATDETMQQLLDLRRRLDDVNVSIEEARSLFKADQPLAFRGDTRSAEVIPASAFSDCLELAALTERLFAVDRTPDRWRSAEIAGAVSALAKARAALGRHPVEARRLIEAATIACDAAAAADATSLVTMSTGRPSTAVG